MATSGLRGAAGRTAYRDTMPVNETKGYHVGQYGWIEVFDLTGEARRWLQGEIVRLIPVSEIVVWALIKTPAGIGAYRIW